MIMNVFLSAFGKATITCCIKYVQCGQKCDIQAKVSEYLVSIYSLSNKKELQKKSKLKATLHQININYKK